MKKILSVVTCGAMIFTLAACTPQNYGVQNNTGTQQGLTKKNTTGFNDVGYNQGIVYRDGTYTGMGNKTSYGNDLARVTIRNGRIDSVTFVALNQSGKPVTNNSSTIPSTSTNTGRVQKNITTRGTTSQTNYTDVSYGGTRNGKLYTNNNTPQPANGIDGNMGASYNGSSIPGRVTNTRNSNGLLGRVGYGIGKGVGTVGKDIRKGVGTVENGMANVGNNFTNGITGKNTANNINGNVGKGAALGKNYEGTKSAYMIELANAIVAQQSTNVMLNNMNRTNTPTTSNYYNGTSFLNNNNGRSSNTGRASGYLNNVNNNNVGNRANPGMGMGLTNNNRTNNSWTTALDMTRINNCKVAAQRALNLASR